MVRFETWGTEFIRRSLLSKYRKLSWYTRKCTLISPVVRQLSECFVHRAFFFTTLVQNTN